MMLPDLLIVVESVQPVQKTFADVCPRTLLLPSVMLRPSNPGKLLANESLLIRAPQLLLRTLTSCSMVAVAKTFPSLLFLSPLIRRTPLPPST